MRLLVERASCGSVYGIRRRVAPAGNHTRVTRRIILGLAFALAACARTPQPPPPVVMTPQSRLIYRDNDGHAVWSQCDRGSRIYMTHTGAFQVVPGGCPDGQP